MNLLGSKGEVQSRCPPEGAFVAGGVCGRRPLRTLAWGRWASAVVLCRLAFSGSAGTDHYHNKRAAII